MEQFGVYSIALAELLFPNASDLFVQNLGSQYAWNQAQGQRGMYPICYTFVYKKCDYKLDAANIEKTKELGTWLVNVGQKVYHATSNQFTICDIELVYHFYDIEFFMPENAPSFCIGCFSCFMEGEETCPHADVVQPIARAINEADLLILGSPCYALGMSGQFKTLLDHLAYRWMIHRPHPKMFSKVGLAISTAAGAGTKKVTKSLKDNLFYWGVPKIYRYGKNVGAMGWGTVKPKKKLQIEKEVRKLSKQISRQIGRAKPGIKTKLMFLIMRMRQKVNNWNPTDKEYWIKKR